MERYWSVYAELKGQRTQVRGARALDSERAPNPINPCTVNGTLSDYQPSVGTQITWSREESSPAISKLANSSAP
jgi:hypothetical protein